MPAGFCGVDASHDMQKIRHDWFPETGARDERMDKAELRHERVRSPDSVVATSPPSRGEEALAGPATTPRCRGGARPHPRGGPGGGKS